ncbi:MAG: response regulator [Pseudomonadota bacterium]
MDSDKYKILIVEDDPPNVLVAENFMEIFGYNSEVADTGAKALELLQNNVYHAVLMDVQMPDMSGLEVTRKIRELEKHKDIPRHYIIGMTAHARPDDREACLDAGMDDYITKPFNPEDLREKIKTAGPLSQVS